MKKAKELWKWIKKNRYLIIIWTASTLFFVYQQTTGLSWDFAVYEMNAEYLCCEGHYFEWTRSPLAPLLMIVSSAFVLFNWNYVAYVYVIIVSAIFGVGSVKLADSFGLDRKLFYALMLSPFALNMGVMAGTELLTLGLLMLFVAHVKEIKGALFVGLAGLARYPSFLFLPLVFLQRNWKKIIASIAVVAILVSPWLLYNEAKRDDPIYSLENTYALTVKERRERGVVDDPDPMHFLSVTGYYLPLLLAGIYLKWKDNWEEKDWVMLVIGGITAVSYLRAPIKDSRYLFNLILPVAYFSYYALEGRHKKLFVGVLALNLIIAGASFISFENYPGVEESIDATGNCMAVSNLWVPMNYYGKPAEAVAPNISTNVEEGNRVVIFKYVHNYDSYVDEEVLEDEPIVKETDEYVVFGDEDKCAPERKADRSFIEREGELREIESCEDIFPSFVCIFSPDKHRYL